MGNNGANNDSLLDRILDAAWTQQPTLMKMLSVVAATLLILAYGAEAVRKLGAHSILVALLLGGGIVLVVGQFIAAKDQARTSGAPRWLKGLRFIVAIVLGAASIMTALVLNEAYLTAAFGAFEE